MIYTIIRYHLIEMCLYALFNGVKSNFNLSPVRRVHLSELDPSMIGKLVTSLESHRSGHRYNPPVEIRRYGNNMKHFSGVYYLEYDNGITYLQKHFDMTITILL